ncbi:MAG: glucan ABC transporter ATP-binding protein/ permease [Burkholderiaceae bacterium]|nr:glucan ABC transporter ATP-binding protein/ permease [Burkholderiaceae bacterium]
MSLLALYRRVLESLGSDKRLAWTLALANVALVLAQFAEPVLFGRIIDRLSAANASPDRAGLWESTWPYLLAWIAFGLFTIACGALIALHADRLAHRRRHIMLRRYFEHVLQLPLSHHAQVHSGRLMKIMLQGTDALWMLWLGFFREHLAAFAALVVLIPIALSMNWRLALLLIGLSALFVAVTRLVLRKTSVLQSRVESHHSDLAEHASDTLGNVALVQSFARIDDEVRALGGISRRLLGAQFPALTWWAVLTVLTRSATTLTVLSIMAAGIWLYIHDMISVGEIVTFTVFSGLVIARLEQAVSFTSRLSQDAPRLRDFFSVLDTVPAIRDGSHAVDPGRLRGEIEFHDVSFSYDGQRAAVEAINFVARPGEMVALVGASGAGKSTALALLYRAFDPQSGRVTIDGVDVRDFRLDALRRNIGVVFQEALLFNRSIADNLRVGDPDASDEALQDAARRAQALDFIEREPEGFDSRIGERGRALSGGERQRLSIARVLLKDPPILILDEATSALDGGTETRLLRALDEVTRNRTTLVIAHRLATIRLASRILVFDQGRIVESGTFDELCLAEGIFARLAREQFMMHDNGREHDRALSEASA